MIPKKPKEPLTKQFVEMNINEKFVIMFFTTFYLFKKYADAYDLIQDKKFYSPKSSTFVFQANLKRIEALLLEKMFLIENPQLKKYIELEKEKKHSNTKRPIIIHRDKL